MLLSVRSNALLSICQVKTCTAYFTYNTNSNSYIISRQYFFPILFFFFFEKCPYLAIYIYMALFEFIINFIAFSRYSCVYLGFSLFVTTNCCFNMEIHFLQHKFKHKKAAADSFCTIAYVFNKLFTYQLSP